MTNRFETCRIDPWYVQRGGHLAELWTQDQDGNRVTIARYIMTHEADEIARRHNEALNNQRALLDRQYGARPADPPTKQDIERHTRGHMRGHFRGQIRDYVFETGDDHAGYPAIWCWVIVEDEAATREIMGQIRDYLEAVIRKTAPNRWPYIRFRTVSEQAELAGDRPGPG